MRSYGNNNPSVHENTHHLQTHTRQYIKLVHLQRNKNLCNIKPPSNAATSKRLEADNDIGQLVVTFFLEVCEYSSSEEDLTLANSKEVRVELESLNL